MKKLVYVMMMLFIFSACSDDDSDETFLLMIQLDHVFGDQELVMEENEYTIEAGQEVTFTMFKYYLSNVALRSNESNRVRYLVPDSYHLIEVKRGGASTRVLAIPNIPLKLYNVLELSIGVDSQANLSLDNPGDLDPSNNMAWDWNTGYKFIRVEGDFTDSGGNRRGLVMHTGENENFKTLSFDLANYITPSNNRVRLTVDASELFKNPNTIDLEEESSFMFGPNAALIGANYANGFITLSP